MGYRLARLICKLFISILYPLRIEGLHHIPASGSVIICPNHVRWVDAILVAVAVRRPIRFMAKDDLFRFRALGALFKLVGAFPVRRGQADRSAVRTALAVLSQGGALGMFPEGTRSRTGQLKRPESGAALLALRACAPVVPVALLGPCRLFRPVRVAVCPPVDLERFRGQRVTTSLLDDVSMAIMAPLASRLGQEPPARGTGVEI